MPAPMIRPVGTELPGRPRTGGRRSRGPRSELLWGPGPGGQWEPSRNKWLVLGHACPNNLGPRPLSEPWASQPTLHYTTQSRPSALG